MDFDLTEEQRMLKDSVDRLIADKYDFEQRKTYLKGENGFSREIWGQFAELGLLALPFAEDDGGFGGGPVETMIVMEAFGRALALEPYLATVVLVAAACCGMAPAPSSARPTCRRSPAAKRSSPSPISERAARYNLAHVETTAIKDGDGWVLERREVARAQRRRAPTT